MKYLIYTFVITTSIALFVVGCSKKEEAYAAGCAAGATEVITSMGYEPNAEGISKFCSEAAKKAN
jgi:hypothetical protein